MKLHTDFHDYYDNAVGYGIDEKVHYNRFTKEVAVKIKSQFDFPNFLETCLLGFCGEVFPIIRLERLDKEYDCEYASDDYNVIETFYAFSFEDYQKKELEWEDFSVSFNNGNMWHSTKIEQFFIDWRFQSDEIFLEHKTPVWFIGLERNSTKGLINPKLKDYGFERIKDSFTAFQEISMYLSNILVEQKEVAKIEDKYRIEQHGFDLKTSFRKEKKK